MNIEHATQFAIEKHTGQKRLGGEDYVTHPIAVSQMMLDKNLPQEMVIAALFHDLLEDTDATEAEILELSNQQVLDAVKLLTKNKGYKMETYIMNIQNNDIALAVKLADRIHNLNSAGIADEKFRRKYVAETEAYYLALSNGTVFEAEMMEAYMRLRDSLLL